MYRNVLSLKKVSIIKFDFKACIPKKHLLQNTNIFYNSISFSINFFCKTSLVISRIGIIFSETYFQFKNISYAIVAPKYFFCFNT